MSVQLVEYKFFHNSSALLRKLINGAPRGCYILVPSSGDVRILEEMLSSDSSLLGKHRKIIRWEELYREAASQLQAPSSSLRRQIDPPDHWLVVNYILKNVIKEAESKVPPSFKRKGFVDLLGKTLRELLREEVLPEHLAKLNGCERCEKGKCPLDTAQKLLCRLYHDYVQYLDDNNLMDSAQTATSVRALLEKTPLSAHRWLKNYHFVFAGFLSFTHGQLLLVRSLKDLGANITILKPQTGLDIHDAKEQLKSITDEIVTLNEQDTVNTIETVLGDQRLELELLARYLVLWSQNKGPFMETSRLPFPGWGKIGMMIESSRLSILKEALQRYNIPYFLENGPAVACTLLWQGAQKAWELHCSNFPTEDTAWLLASPYMAGESFPLDKAMDELPKGIDGWRTFLSSNAPSALKHFDRIVKFAQKIESGGSPTELFDELMALAGMDNKNSEWGMNISSETLNFPELDEKARQLNEALKELKEKAIQIREVEPNLGAAGHVHLQKDNAIAFLSAWAERSNLWRGPRIKNSVSIYTATPPVLTYHDVWILTGSDSSSWPGNLRQSPLLTDEERESLHEDPSLELGAFHLPLLSEIRQQRHALFRRLLCCGKSVTVVSRPLQDDAGRPLRRSPFFEKAAEGTEPWVISLGEEPIIKGLKDVIPSDEDFRILPIEVREIDEPSTPKDRLPEGKELPTAKAKKEITKANLSDLDIWCDCPFRYFVARHLKIEEPIVGLFDPRKAGTFIHHLWEESWKRKSETDMPLEQIIDTIWEQGLQEYYPELLNPKGPLYRHNKRLKFQAKRLCQVQEELEERLKNTKKGQLTEETVSITVGDMPFSGRCDRVDILDDGVIIYDYKLGKASSYSKALQLASYALAWEEKENAPPVKGVIYLGMSDGGATIISDSDELKVKGKRNKPLKDAKEEAIGKLAEMAQALKEGTFFPNYNSKTCGMCGYIGLCRKHEAKAGGTEENG